MNQSSAEAPNNNKAQQPDGKLQPNAYFLKEENDWVLENYIRNVNGTEDEILITLLLDGFLLTGFLVGGNRYFQKIQNDLREQDSGNLTEVINNIQSHIDGYISDRDNAEIGIAYFHLLEARFHHPLGQGMPANGTEFRGKLNRVSGFYLGGYLPPVDESV